MTSDQAAQLITMTATMQEQLAGIHAVLQTSLWTVGGMVVAACSYMLFRSWGGGQS